LTRLGHDKKIKILRDVGDDKEQEGMVKDKMEQIEKELEKEFELEDVYKERFEKKVPDTEVEKIVKDF